MTPRTASGSTGRRSSPAPPAWSAAGWCAAGRRGRRRRRAWCATGCRRASSSARRCSSASRSCAATSAIRRCSSARSASTRSTRSSTSRRRPSSAIANRNPVSTFETNIARHLGAARGLPAQPDGQADRRRLVRQGLRRPRRSCRTPRTTPLLGRHPYDVSKSCADLIAQTYATTYGLPVVHHALRQLLRRRRPQLEPHRARHDPLGPARPAAGHPLRRQVRPRLLLRRGRRDRLHAAGREARRRAGRCAGGPSTSRTRSRSPCSSWSIGSSRLMGSTLEPDVRNEASNEIRHQYLSAAAARRDARLEAAVHARRGAAPTIDWYRRSSQRRRRCVTRRCVRCRSCGSDAARAGPLARRDAARQLAAAARAIWTSPEPRFPLDLVFCTTCSLVQITETVPPEQLFRDYLYFSSFSETMLAHARDLVEPADRASSASAPRSLAVEIASNDGYLLAVLQARRASRCSASSRRENIARVADRERGIPTLSEFFGVELARAAGAPRARRADVIHANNVLAHVPDLNGFVDGIRELLTDDGVAVHRVPVPRGHDRALRVRHDLSRAPLLLLADGARRACSRGTAWSSVDVERLPIHGGSLLLTVGRAIGARASAAVGGGAARRGARARVWTRSRFYRASRGGSSELKAKLRGLLGTPQGRGQAHRRLRRRREGQHAAQHLRHRHARRSTSSPTAAPHKQGLFMPGVRIPIVRARAAARATRPTTRCCSPGTSPTRSCASRTLSARAAASSSCRSRTSACLSRRPMLFSANRDRRRVPDPAGAARGRARLLRAHLVRARVRASTASTRASSSAASPSTDTRGTLRGMHFQAAAARGEQARLAAARARSTTSSSTCARLAELPALARRSALTAENLDALFVPAGCAHGFITLVDDAVVRYDISEFHTPGAERGFRFDDPAFGIEWPLAPVVISPRDLAFPPYAD